MAEKRYTEYIIHGIIDGLTDAKPTRPDIALLKQRLYELSAIEKERLTQKPTHTTQKSKRERKQS